MRVFLDTNVWLAALRARGLCSELLEWLLEHETILTSQSVIDEVKEKPADKFMLSSPVVRDAENFLRQHCERVDSTRGLDVDVDDPDDIPILAAALAGQADVFITGDKGILEFPQIEAMRVLTPRAFWNTYVT
jgi:putative PIN family toxin of toxin-antitoxin system